MQGYLLFFALKDALGKEENAPLTLMGRFRAPRHDGRRPLEKGPLRGPRAYRDQNRAHYERGLFARRICLESLESLHSLEPLESNSLESRENGLFQKAPFSKLGL